MVKLSPEKAKKGCTVKVPTLDRGKVGPSLKRSFYGLNFELCRLAFEYALLYIVKARHTVVFDDTDHLLFGDGSVTRTSVGSDLFAIPFR